MRDSTPGRHLGPSWATCCTAIQHAGIFVPIYERFMPAGGEPVFGQEQLVGLASLDMLRREGKGVYTAEFVGLTGIATRVGMYPTQWESVMALDVQDITCLAAPCEVPEGEYVMPGYEQLQLHEASKLFFFMTQTGANPDARPVCLSPRQHIVARGVERILFADTSRRQYVAAVRRPRTGSPIFVIEPLL